MWGKDRKKLLYIKTNGIYFAFCYLFIIILNYGYVFFTIYTLYNFYSYLYGLHFEAIYEKLFTKTIVFNKKRFSN